MSEDSATYRAEASLCQEQARRSRFVEDKEHWLRLAADWLALASQVEANNKPTPFLHLVPEEGSEDESSGEQS